jgi:signal transduction histidine kinase
MQELQQNFMMAVTHELKTPIAVAKLNLETLLTYPLDETKRRQVIESALEETNRLNTLASNILVSAQLEEPGHRVARERLDFSALVKNICGELRTRLPQRAWEIGIDPGLILAGDPLLLRMLVNNILENAIKYSPPSSPISIHLQKEGNHIVLRIADQGIRIPGPEKKRIFDKFYRLGNEGTRVAQGTGLGLWLCKKIAADHHARITVSDNSPAGTIFAIIFQKGNPRV